MKVIKTIPLDDFNITIFYWNQKYLIKFEIPDFEQTYKISELDISGEADLDAIIADKQFLEEVNNQFIHMQSAFRRVAEGF
ncbi:MAG TPA: hypothetical protein DCM08_08760 [Microscillaceae bacterium]|jgi:hypothetical protein|nr:hypothetical protein [Microscillaceae bacterium]